VLTGLGPLTAGVLPGQRWALKWAYVCPGTAPNTFQVIANEIGTVPNEEFVSDDCGTFTEP
jgi:hypothetical protein